jgi:hypothetical protein
VNLNARVSAVEAADWLRTARVCRHLIYFWRAEGRLSPVGKRGRSPLYRWADVLAVEHATRSSPLGAPRTSSCRSCERAAERDLVPAA